MPKFIAIPMIIVVTVVTLANTFYFRHDAEAAPTTPPLTMSPLDAARLHADIAEISVANSKIESIKAQVAPLEKHATDILGAYKIAPADFGKSVTVDFDTGAITRAQPKMMPATPVPAQAKAVQK